MPTLPMPPPETVEAVDENDEVTPPETHPPTSGRLLVVAIGASAGGLEAFTDLLDVLPPDLGIAYVYVVHQASGRDSGLAEILRMHTAMPAVVVNEELPLQPDHVYLAPPGIQLSVLGLHLVPTPRPTDRTQYTPIDALMSSLAKALETCAVGVVLSGTGVDGSTGLREIKGVGGITIAQDPETARYDGMPRAAIATGSVDLVHERGRLSTTRERPALDRIARQLGDRAQPERPHQPRLVKLDRLARDAEDVPDLASRPTLGDQLQDLALTRRQLVAEPVFGPVHPRLVGQRRRHERAARQDRSDRQQQLGRGRGLHHVAPRPGAKRRLHVVRIGVHRDEDDPPRGVQPLQLPRGVEPVEQRHRHVDEHHVGSTLLGRGHQRPTVGHRPHNIDFVGQKAHEALTDQRVIFGHQHPRALSLHVPLKSRDLVHINPRRSLGRRQ